MSEGYEFRVWLSKDGWRWNLRSIGNDKLIATSGESFYDQASAERSAALVQRVAGSAPIRVIR
ncbi:MAG TPA: YegP family protein [Actinomycetota bacterium]|nr:YegP family protein [Actinomycetota bacterium]